MKKHTARDKDNKWQYENTIHLWIQIQIIFALQQEDTGMRCAYSSSTGGYLICNWQPEYLPCVRHKTKSVPNVTENTIHVVTCSLKA